MTARILKLVPRLLLKRITFFGQAAVIACDGRCDKAWGINGRPKISLRHTMLPEDPDDYVYVGDHALGKAPPPGETVGQSEGGDFKPSATSLADGEDMNRWCARECERRVMVKPGEDLRLPDLEHPAANIERRRPTGGRSTDSAEVAQASFGETRNPAEDTERELMRRMFATVQRGTWGSR